jgi:hypothetical protein
MHMTKDDVPVAWSGAPRTAEMAPGPTLTEPVRQPPGVSFILNLQRQVGNAAVARLLIRDQSAQRKACCTSCSRRGGGQPRESKRTSEQVFPEDLPQRLRELRSLVTVDSRPLNRSRDACLHHGLITYLLEHRTRLTLG